MDLEHALRLTNRNLIVTDLALGTGALLAPDLTLRVLGHDEPSPDARHLFRRCGPIWLTFAAAHAVAARRDEPDDWWALAWLRGTEIATDVVWAHSESFSRPGARAWDSGLRAASTSRSRSGSGGSHASAPGGRAGSCGVATDRAGSPGPARARARGPGP